MTAFWYFVLLPSQCDEFCVSFLLERFQCLNRFAFSDFRFMVPTD